MRRTAAIWAATTAIAALAGAAAAAPAVQTGPYYERTLMGEAGRRCGLFTPAVLRSLDAGAAQARAASLAAAPTQQVDAARHRAMAKARGVSCRSPDLRIAAQRVRAAFLSWSRQGRLDLPGRGGGWVAERPWKAGARFALSTRASLEGRPAVFGLARLGGSGLALVADIAAPDAGRAYAARLIMRDPARAPAPYLARDGQPPQAAARVLLAQAREPSPATLPRGLLFRFPAKAVDDLAALDPRESVRLELVFAAARGDRVVSTLIPVGDFATGRAFLAAAP